MTARNFYRVDAAGREDFAEICFSYLEACAIARTRKACAIARTRKACAIARTRKERSE